MKRFALVVLCLGFALPVFGATDLFRLESAFQARSDFQLNQVWWVHTAEHYQFQLYGYYESSSGRFTDIDVAAGPKFKLGKMSLVVPVGLRFDPENDMKATHVITKANVSGRIGDWSVLAINDLSWGLDGRTNGHFLQYQFAWQEEGARCGIGIQADTVLSGSREVTTKIGPVAKLRFLETKNERRTWKGVVDVFPFYETTHSDYGVKFNFLVFRFGR